MIDPTCHGDSNGAIELRLPDDRWFSTVLKDLGGQVIEQRAVKGNSTRFDGLVSGLYFVEYTDLGGLCPSAKIKVEIFNPQEVVSNFSVSKDSILVGEPVEFDNQSTGATSYQWNFGDQVTSILEEPSYSYGTPGTYEVFLVAEYDLCRDTSSHFVQVNARPSTLSEHKSIPLLHLSSDAIHIRINETGSHYLKLSDAMGKLLYERNFAGADHFDFNLELSSGTYIVELDGSSHKRVVH